MLANKTLLRIELSHKRFAVNCIPILLKGHSAVGEGIEPPSLFRQPPFSKRVHYRSVILPYNYPVHILVSLQEKVFILLYVNFNI